MIAFLIASLGGSAPAFAAPFALRGYYVTFMRMPTFSLATWKEMIDCMERDGANTLLLWTAGAFPSRKFPVTWQYNADHENVRHHFVSDLITYAQSRKIKVLLGFTPFAYDGVNQYTLQRPELRATEKNGQPARFWGMHSWGYNLCPSQPESQRFMFEYVREMWSDFYPNADGLLIESSDYAICHCRNCGTEYYDREFAFVSKISNYIWERNPAAMIMVYPHYFSGRPAPGFGTVGGKQKFDDRWTLFFTPHSAHIDTELLGQAKTSVLWTEGLSLGTPWKIRDGARLAQKHGIPGYVPSLEPMTCVDGPPGSGKPRQKPFHFDWLRDGEMPLNELLIRVNRIAYREFSGNPGLSEGEFKRVLGKEILGETGSSKAVDDLLFLQECWVTGADWFAPSVLRDPVRLQERAQRDKWPAEKMAECTDRIVRLREIALRYAKSTLNAEREMHRIAAFMTQGWEKKR